LTTTNKFRTGGKDSYRFMGEFPVAQQLANINVRKIPSNFYKIIIETPGNIINRWVLPVKIK
jgi:hypothetical protein